MFSLLSELCSVAGGLLSLVGAITTARAVLISEDQAIWIGLPRYAGSDRDEQLKNPNVQNLLKGSKAAKNGLYWIAIGVFLQTVPAGIMLTERILG